MKNNRWMQNLVRWVQGEPPLPPKEGKLEISPDPADHWLAGAQIHEKTFRQRMAHWLELEGKELFRFCYRICAIGVCLIVILTLLETVSYLPNFGNASNLVNNEVSERYITRGLQETGATNIVAGMILDYRAFDTLGESHVLFLAACCVIILLRQDRDEKGQLVISEMGDDVESVVVKKDLILRKTAAILVPFIFLYGIYVILNGHLSAGGGFSGGAVLGAGMILYRNAYGYERAARIFTPGLFRGVTTVSLLTYACLKGYSFYTGANHLESGIPLGTPGAILSGGLILPLNICVGCVVACTMYTFYTLFRKGRI